MRKALRDTVSRKSDVTAKHVLMMSVLQFVDEWIESTVEPSYMKFIKKCVRSKTKI